MASSVAGLTVRGEDWLLAVLLTVCLFTDLSRGKIYNKVTFPVFLVAIFWHFLRGGVRGGVDALAGALVGVALFFSFFALGWLKAGDVKLLGAVGALKGVRFVVETGLLSLVAGGAIAFCLLLRTRWLKNFGVKFVNMIFLFFTLKKPYFEGEKELAFPYSVSIALGTLGTYWLEAKGVFLWH